MASKPNLPPPENVTCNGCFHCFPINKIRRHLGQKRECKDQYSEADLRDLNTKCFNYAKLLKKKHNKERYQQNKLVITQQNASSVKKHAKKLYDKARNSRTNNKVRCDCCRKRYVISYFNRHLGYNEKCFEFYDSSPEHQKILENIGLQLMKRKKDLKKISNKKYQTKMATIQQEKRFQQSQDWYVTHDQVSCRGCKQLFDKKDLKNHVDQTNCEFIYTKNKKYEKDLDKYTYKGPTVSCISCKTVFPVKSIQHHLNQMTSCKNQYSEEEFSKLLVLCEKSKKEHRKLHQIEIRKMEREQARKTKILRSAQARLNWVKTHGKVNNSKKLSITSFNNVINNITQLREFGVSDIISQKLDEMEDDIKQMLKDLKQELDDFANEINEMTGLWHTDNVEVEVEMDCKFVDGMFEFFEYYINDEIKKIKDESMKKLKNINDDVGYVAPTLSMKEIYKSLQEMYKHNNEKDR